MSVLTVVRRAILVEPRPGGLGESQLENFRHFSGVFTSSASAQKPGKVYRVFTRTSVDDVEACAQSGAALQRNLCSFNEASAWTSMMTEVKELLQRGCSEITSMLEEQPGGGTEDSGVSIEGGG
mgnify:CR=1 FL=1